MSTSELPLGDPLQPNNVLKISISFAALYIVFKFVSQIYDAFFGPLSKFPGPKLRAFSIIPQIRSTINGDDGVDIPALHQKYGAVVRLSPRELSFAGGAQAWKDVYGFNANATGGLVKERMFYGRPFNNVDGIITSDNANHSRQRKILSHSFSDKALREQEPILKTWSLKLKNKLAERATGVDETDMLKFYNCTTFDVMGDLTFAEGLNMLDDSEYSPWVKTIFAGIKHATLFRGVKAFSSLGNWFIEEVLFKNPNVRKKQKEHWDYSTERVDRRLKRTPDRPDLWTKILEKSNGPDALSTEEHHSIASLFMIAGTETTATALSGTTYYLLQNPDKLEKLTAEIRSAFSSFDDISLDGLARLKYLQAVLQEGMRMYPPVPIKLPRVTPPGGATIDGYSVPGGVSVGVHNLSTYRMEEHFKKPYEFHPERWLKDPEFKDDHLDALEPFSVGPRNCLGKVSILFGFTDGKELSSCFRYATWTAR